MTDDAWKTLVRRYADGRQICNCGSAYYTPCGHGSIVVDGRRVDRTDMLVCEYGCSANLLRTRDEIGPRALADLGG